MIGSLLYFNASRPNILFRILVCARFQAKFKGSNLIVVKCILLYSNLTIEYDIQYSRDSNTEHAGYSDAGWVDGANDKKTNSVGGFS